MQYIIDIILLAVFGLMIYLGGKKGFFLTLAELVTYIISLVAAKIGSTIFAPVVYDNFVKADLTSRVEASLGQSAGENYVQKFVDIVDSIPTRLDGVLHMIGVEREALAQKISSIDASGQTNLELIMSKIISPVASAIIQTLLFIVITIVLGFVLRLIIRMMNKIIKKRPTIKQVNASFGAVLGALKGILLVVVLAIIIGSLSGVIGSEKFVELVGDSFIVNWSKRLFDSISGYATV